MPRLGNATIYRLRAELVKVGTSMQRDWANASELEIRFCNVQPLGTSEMIQDREYAITHRRVYAPAGTDITSNDRVLIDGAVWEVDGEPLRYADLRSVPDHITFDVFQKEG